ncbi:MAG: hypothetical protein R2939_05540 [Kofleriaceae bacterium]
MKRALSLPLCLLLVAACGPSAREAQVDGGVGECPPGGRGCVGDDVVACNADGTPGAVVETCGAAESCSLGECVSGCASAGADFVYVVDDTNRLLRFDPTQLAGTPFTVLGTLSCPAGAPLGGGGGAATPFSMSVDRNAVAWILYSSGEIFQVPVDTLACTNSGFVPEQQGMSLFGMGFVSDTAGGATEQLFIAGGDLAGTPGGKLGVIDPATKQVSLRGDIRSDTEYSAELTGTGAAELYGFYPGIDDAFVQQLDRASGAAVGPEFAVAGGLAGGDPFASVRAWAFAQYGGTFYLFVTVEDLLSGTTNSQVRTINPTTGASAVALQNLPYIIVGAGVSTCAPVVID